MEYDILQNCDKLCVSVRHVMGFSYTRFTNKGNMKNLQQIKCILNPIAINAWSGVVILDIATM